MKKTKLSLISTICLVFPSIVVAALTQGSLGTTSTGTVDITITKTAGVQITDLANFTFGSVTAAPAAINDDICVFSNNSGGYSITATSTNASGTTFRLNDGSTGYINYSVKWNDVAGTTGSTSLGSGTNLTTQSGANAVDPTCGGGTNANLEVTIDSTTFSTAPTGAYTDVLTILISPV